MPGRDRCRLGDGKTMSDATGRAIRTTYRRKPGDGRRFHDDFVGRMFRRRDRTLADIVPRSTRCDCGAAVPESGSAWASALANKIRAYALQDEGCNTVEANERFGFKPDQRDHGMGVQATRSASARCVC